MINKYLESLGWEISNQYADESVIVDSEDFMVVDVDSSPILQNYDEILGIDHWSESKEAFKSVTKDQHEATQRMVSMSPDMYRFICSLEKWWPVDSDEYRELNRIRQFIENNVDTGDED